MQFIRAYQILRLLADFAVHRRKKLRADRSVKHIQKNLPQFLLPAGIRIIFYKMTHQRLRHACIHTVHGHVIPVIGCPAQCQLGHVARSDHQPACSVGDIHQHLGSLSCLAVFKGYIMYVAVLSDITEMQTDRLPDIHLGQSGAQRPGQPAGIIIGPVRRSEAGHGNGMDIFPGKPQHIKGAYCNEKRQCGIQSAGNTHDRRFAADMLISLFQAEGLDGKDLIAAVVSFRLIRGHKGHAVIPACQDGIRFFHMHRKVQIAFLIPQEGVHAPAFMTQPLNIDFPIYGFILKASGPGQNRAIFRNYVMTIENKILGGFPLPRTGIHITGNQAGAGALYQLLPVGILSYRFVGSGQIHDHGRSGHRMGGGRCFRRPHILTDFTGNLQPVHRIHTEKDMRAKRDFLTVKHKVLSFRISCHKIPRLIKFTIIGYGFLRDKCQDFPVLENRRHIEQLPAFFQRKPYENKRVPPSGIFPDFL